jgi:putative transposase
LSRPTNVIGGLLQDVAKRLQEIIFELVAEHGWKMIALEIMRFCTFTFSSMPPLMNQPQILQDG